VPQTMPLIGAVWYVGLVPFEVFTNETASTSAKPTLSIHRNGVILLNKAAYGKLGKPSAVELLFDSTRQLVGLRPADQVLPHTKSVRPNARGSAYLVTAARFLGHYNINFEVARRWPAQMEDDVLFVDISGPPEV